MTRQTNIHEIAYSSLLVETGQAHCIEGEEHVQTRRGVRAASKTPESRGDPRGVSRASSLPLDYNRCGIMK